MQLRYFMHLNASGYSISAQEYIFALRVVNPSWDVKIYPLNKDFRGVSDNRLQLFKSMELAPPRIDYVSLQHCLPTTYRHDRARVKIGFAIFETIDPPREWVDAMNRMDAIMVASHFNKHVFENAGVKTPITVVPHCFDPAMFHPKVLPTGRMRQFTFMTVGTWKKRKAHETLIKAFYSAFEEGDNVCLVIKTNQATPVHRAIKDLKQNHGWRTKRTAPIYVDSSILKFEEVPAFMKREDAIVIPSMGEGFCLPGMHAMALGIPLLMTEYGGSLEYAKPELYTPLKPKFVQKMEMDGIPQFAKKIWAQVPVESLATAMRDVVSKREEVTTKAVAAATYIHANFNREIVGLRFDAMLKEVGIDNAGHS